MIQENLGIYAWTFVILLDKGIKTRVGDVVVGIERERSFILSVSERKVFRVVNVQEEHRGR